MLQETETYSADTSFADFLTDTMSGANHVSEDFSEPPPESTTTETTGAPPVAPSSDSSQNPTSSEGAPAAALSAPADGPTAPSPTATPEANPFAAASPLTYTVNGQQRTFEGIAYVPGVGAVVQDADVQKLQQRLSERDNLYERSQQSYEQVQALERLMTWTQTGTDGKETVLQGAQAQEAMRVELGRALATLDTVTSFLKDPAKLASLVAMDGEKLVHNQTALQHLTTLAELAETKAERMVRQHWATIASPTTSPTTTTSDLTQAAPAIAQHYATQYGNGVLTPDDVAFLSGQVGRYIRPATREDVTGGGARTIGEPVVDATFQTVVEDRAALRKATASAVSAASSVATENARKLQAALLPNGKAPTTTNTQRPTPRPTPTADPSEQDKHDLFRKMEQTAFAAM